MADNNQTPIDGIARRDLLFAGAGAAAFAAGTTGGGTVLAQNAPAAPPGTVDVERRGSACATDQSVANAALLERYVAAVNAHDTSSFASIFTDTYLQRSGRSPPGLAAQIENAQRIFTALPDLHLVIEDRIFGGDRIVARCTYTGTQSGKFLGIEPTGKQIRFGTIDIWRVEGDRLAEHWDQVDFAGILKQLREG
jgi:predicted ester cyclase